MKRPAQQNPDEQIPDAMPAAQPGQAVPELRLGDPFAIAYEADLVDAKGGGGCTAILQCDCGQKFRIDLLAAGVKYCPACQAGFTHALLVSSPDNVELVAAAMETVLLANGLQVPGDDDEGDDDEGDDDEGDDDEGDDDGQGDDEQPETDQSADAYRQRLGMQRGGDQG